MAADRAASPSAATSTRSQRVRQTEWREDGGWGVGRGICMLEQAASEMGNAIAIDDDDGGGHSQC